MRIVILDTCVYPGYCLICSKRNCANVAFFVYVVYYFNAMNQDFK